MLEYKLTLDSALKMLLEANALYKNGTLPLSIYLAHVSKDYFIECGNELGIALCNDIIDNVIVNIQAKVIVSLREKGGRLTKNRLEKALASSDDVADLSELMTEDVFEDRNKQEQFYNKLVHCALV